MVNELGPPEKLCVDVTYSLRLCSLQLDFKRNDVGTRNIEHLQVQENGDIDCAHFHTSQH